MSNYIIWQYDETIKYCQSRVCVCVCGRAAFNAFVIVFIYLALLLYLHMISFFVCLSSFEISCQKHYVGERNPPNGAKIHHPRETLRITGNIIWATVNRAGGPTASCKQEGISLFWGENLLFDGSEIRRSHVWHVWNPVNSGILTISTGAGFLPSTVCAYKLLLSDISHQPTWHQHSINFNALQKETHPHRLKQQKQQDLGSFHVFFRL